MLDLVYEARDIDQRLGSEDRIDAWFDAKTKVLNDWQKTALREQWGTMQHMLSSKSRMDRVVADIVFDFGVKHRLSNQRGNAILVASSIYEACKYFELFQKTAFKGIQPDGWRSVQTKENVIKAALYGLLQNVVEVERIFLIIRQQREY